MLQRRSITFLLSVFFAVQLLCPNSDYGRGQQPAGRTWAVVIGIAKYSKLPGGLQLQFGDQDAKAFASAIEAAGVPSQNIKLLTGPDATADAIRAAIGTWLARSASPEDTVYIFFSGHGYVERDFNDSYLLSYDSDPQNIYATGISAAELEYVLDHRIRARRVLFLQDAERRDFFGNNPTGRADSSTFGSSFSHLASSRPGISLITACSPGEFSWEGRRWGDMGAFTKYIVEGLSGKADKDGDGTVTDSELFAYLAERLPKDTSNKQHPWRAGASQLLIAMAGRGAGSSPGPSSPSTALATASSNKSEPTAPPATSQPAPSRTGAAGSQAKTESQSPATAERTGNREAEAPAAKPTPEPARTGEPPSSEKQPQTSGRSEPVIAEAPPNKPSARNESERARTPEPKPAPPGPPTIGPVSSTAPAPGSSPSGSVAAPGTGEAPSPLLDEMSSAITSGRLLEPGGAWDMYQRLNDMQPSPARLTDLRVRLANALLQQSQQILSLDSTIDVVSNHLDDFKRAGRMLGMLRELGSAPPDFPTLQKLSAVDALIALQFYDEAEESLGPLKDSTSAPVQNTFGLLYKGQYDDWRAEHAFKRAAELDPKWATPHFNLGLLYQGQGKADALPEFEQAASLDPSNARFQEALGDEYFRRQQFTKAEAAYRAAIAATPNNDTLHTKLGHALYSEGRRDEADKEYKRALQLSGQH